MLASRMDLFISHNSGLSVTPFIDWGLEIDSEQILAHLTKSPNPVVLCIR
jgi:hypothetical protein